MPELYGQPFKWELRNEIAQLKRDYWGGSARPPQKAANRKIRISSRTRRFIIGPIF